MQLGTKLAGVYLAILIGVLWRFSRFYKAEYSKWFTTVCIWIFFPITILVSILGVESIAISIFIGVGIFAVLVHLLSYGSILLISKRKNLIQQSDDDRSIGAQALVSSFPNALLYPFPIILAILGDGGLQMTAATVFVFFALILRNSLGVYIGVNHSSRINKSSSSLQIRKTLLAVTKFPPFIALIVGFVILSIFGPQEVSSPVIRLAKDISMWGSLLLVGLSFQDLTQLKPKNLFSSKTLEVACVRFGFAPIVGLLFISLWQFSPAISFAIMIQCMSPPAVANILYGKFFGLPEDEISIYISSVTFLALLILPLELFLLQLLYPI